MEFFLIEKIEILFNPPPSPHSHPPNPPHPPQPPYTPRLTLDNNRLNTIRIYKYLIEEKEKEKQNKRKRKRKKMEFKGGNSLLWFSLQTYNYHAKLKKVWLQTCHFFFVFLLNFKGGNNLYRFLLQTYSVPSGSITDLRTEREARVYGWDGWDGWMGWDGISKVSFNFFHTLWVYR